MSDQDDIKFQIRNKFHVIERNQRQIFQNIGEIKNMKKMIRELEEKSVHAEEEISDLKTRID